MVDSTHAVRLHRQAESVTLPDNSTTPSLQGAVHGSWRSTAHKARDHYRHPVDTLQFFGIEPGMTVIEVEPGDGCYTEILAPFLHARGHLIEASAPTGAAQFEADSAQYGRIEKVITFAPPDQGNLGAANSAVMVLTFRNTHDWLNDSPATLAAILKAAFDVLKPGGVFGVTEHRAKPFANAVGNAKALHRIPEDYLIALALKSGFRLADVSEINANPKDPEDINTACRRIWQDRRATRQDASHRRVRPHDTPVCKALRGCLSVIVRYGSRKRRFARNGATVSVRSKPEVELAEMPTVNRRIPSRWFL